MPRIQRMAIDITPQKCWCLPRGVQWIQWNKLGTWHKSHSISVKNKKTIGVKFRMIIFSTIMGSVHVVWPIKYNWENFRPGIEAFTSTSLETLSQFLIFCRKHRIILPHKTKEFWIVFAKCSLSILPQIRQCSQVSRTKAIWRWHSEISAFGL
jgi:hypothetical protein